MDGNGLWFNRKYTATQWQNAIVSLSARYASNPLVIGNDLRNEIRSDIKNGLIPEWGTGSETDWAKAATECGNEVLKVAPDQLVIIEGMRSANNLRPIRDHWIELNVPNKLVYSYHMYSFQPVTSYKTYDKYEAGLEPNVGYLLEDGHPYTAPLWLGEFGENQDNNYWSFTMRWLSEHDQVGWSQWAWNGYKTTPDEDESYGIMEADMATVRQQWMLDDLAPIQTQPTSAFEQITQ